MNQKILNIDEILNKFKYKLNKKNNQTSKIIGFITTGIIETNTVKNKSLFLHGSSFLINNQGYFFIGSSGAGKSTIIKKIPYKNILSDDTTVIKKIKNK